MSWYRFRATFAQQWATLLSIVLLIGLLGGLAMASIGIARRTQSSYPTFLASSNPSTLTMAVYQATANGGPGPDLTSAIERIPGLQRLATVLAPKIAPLNANDAPNLAALGSLVVLGSLDGELLHQDKLAIVSGRLANPNSVHELTMTQTAAQLLGVHVGETLGLGLYLAAQTSEPGFGTPRVPPALLIRARLVGISEMNTQVVQDDVDRAYGFIFLTPATIRAAMRVSPLGSPALYAMQFRSDAPSIASIEQRLVDTVPRGNTYEFHVTSTVTAEVELAIKPESIALGAFGMIAGLVCLALAAQTIARRLRSNNADRDILRAIGASPTETAADGLPGVFVAIALGTLVAVGVAVALSPLGPIGPVRPVYPNEGPALDWVVLGIGIALLVVLLSSVAVAVAVSSAPGHRRATKVRRSILTHAAAAAGVPVTGVVGVHFALEPGGGRVAVPTRSVMAGSVLAIGLIIATLTFASSLSTLVSHPPLYGWNWEFALNPTNDVPPAALSLLAHDRDVAAWSGADYTDAEVDGQTVPILLQAPRATVAPPILTGHGVEANNQVVLGAATLALLHKQVGDTVVFSYGTRSDAPAYVPPTTLRIVGTATLPAIGYSSFVAEHTSMGTGAILPNGVQPAAFLAALRSPDPNLNGPELVFVRLRHGVSMAEGRVDMQRIADAANRAFNADPNATGNEVGVLSVLRPAQIVNYHAIGSTPVALAICLAAGAVGALALMLGASVRKRRRELALLKTLGFTRRQVMTTTAWQATVDSVIGVVIGVPLGIALGRELWIGFAQTINAVPEPTVPALSVLIVVAGAFVFTILASVLPARTAARTPTGLVLRAE